MVEAGAKEVSEEVMLDAILFAHEEIKKIVAFQDQIVAEIGKEKAVSAPGDHRRRREGRRAGVSPWRSASGCLTPLTGRSAKAARPR